MKLIRLPGLIDTHVHLRDPGETQKEDFLTGTTAALSGGVTTIFDMPNNLKPVFTLENLNEKISIAQKKAVCDWGLYFGSVGDNLDQFEKVLDKVVGLKIYLSLTTGKYVVADEDKIKSIFTAWPKDKIIVFHAEGDRVDLALKMCTQFKNKIHITHVNTAESLSKIIQAKKDNLPVTCDVTPHHLFLTEGDRPRMGTVPNLYLVKPPLSTKKDQDFLWQNLNWIDCFVSDHAPHLMSEKKSDNPPAGIPGLETMLPLFLTAVRNGRLSLNDLINKSSTNPRKIFGLKKDVTSFVDVDLDEKYTIENKNLKTKCVWSPYSGWKVSGRVKKVYLHNTLVFADGKLLTSKGFGNRIN